MSASIRSSQLARTGTAPSPVSTLTSGPLRAEELFEADHVFRLAFGTYLGLPEPSAFFAGREFIAPRWRVDPSATLAAQLDGQVIGSNLATAWGSVGFFGPLTVRPDFWDRGVAKRLLEPTMALLDSWKIRHAGLFTFAQSPKHVGLYQKFGFSPRFLTAIMTKPVEPPAQPQKVATYSALRPSQQAEAVRACGELTNGLFEGLDLAAEIRAVHQHRLGDTVLVWGSSGLDSFAVCHFGAGTEGGQSCCYVKFAAARPGPHAGTRFEHLLAACESMAAAQGLPSLEAGVSLARDDAYRRMLGRGFRTAIQGVTMHKPNEPAYHRPEVYAIDDWR